jgi:hypothetical protein
MNNRSVYPPNNIVVNSSKYRKWTKVVNKDDSQSENAAQVFKIHKDDFCGAYIQKFYSKGSSIYNSKEQSIVDAKLAKNIPYNVTNNGGVAPYKINIGNIVYTNWATSEFYKAGNSDNVVTYGPAGPCMILQSSE